MSSPLVTSTVAKPVMFCHCMEGFPAYSQQAANMGGNAMTSPPTCCNSRCYDETGGEVAMLLLAGAMAESSMLLCIFYFM